MYVEPVESVTGPNSELAYGMFNDVAPPLAKAGGALISLIFIQIGIFGTDLKLCVALTVLSTMWALSTRPLLQGYLGHLLDSLTRRSFGDGGFVKTLYG